MLLHALLDHRPSHRPTAVDLLNMLPSAAFPDPDIKSALHSLSVPQSVGFVRYDFLLLLELSVSLIRLMDALFNHERSHRLQQSLEREALKLNGEIEELPVPTMQDLLAQDHLVDQLTQYASFRKLWTH